MSTAWYKPSAVPKLLRSFPRNKGKSGIAAPSIEVWNTTCIVTNFGRTKQSACTVLINPSNSGLTGVKKFPYFPRGGPEPREQQTKDEHNTMGYVSQWGGMDAGSGMLFAANVVDGLVHQLGGRKLALHCEILPSITNGEKCPVGHAVCTPAGGAELKLEYDTIVNTVPPFYEHHSDPEHYLAECYKEAILLAGNVSLPESPLRIASPLLGAGGRGFPTELAVKIAASACVTWREGSNDGDTVLAFGIPDMSTAESLMGAINMLDKSCE